MGLRLGFPVITADRAWARVDVGVEIVLIRWDAAFIQMAEPVALLRAKRRQEYQS